MNLASIARAVRAIHPRAMIDALLTYPRFLGTIKPELLGKTEDELHAHLTALSAAWWPRHLVVPVGKTVVVVAPHPDDETIGAGGFLLRHRDLCTIHIINIFSGDGGGQLPGRPWEPGESYRAELVARRKEELQQAAVRLHVATVSHLELTDGSRGTSADVTRLRLLLDELDPDVVLIPWFLDAQPDHRTANVLYASASPERNCLVIAYEVWSMLQPNATMDITDVLAEKLQLIDLYGTQTETVNYGAYADGLAKVRAFQHPVQGTRAGAAEAFIALPSRDYCDFVLGLYGPADRPTASANRLLK